MTDQARDKDVKTKPAKPTRRLGTEEVWDSVVEYPDYEVSTHGRVRRVIPGRTLGKPRVLGGSIEVSGYVRVKLTNAHGKKTIKVHRLVALAFLSRDEGRDFVAHGDGNPANNHVSNLRWATCKENLDDRKRHGTDMIGTRNGRARLSEADVQKIKGQMTGRYGEVAHLAREYGVAHTTMLQVTTGLTWRHV